MVNCQFKNSHSVPVYKVKDKNSIIFCQDEMSRIISKNKISKKLLNQMLKYSKIEIIIKIMVLRLK